MSMPSIEEIVNYFNDLPQSDQQNLLDLLARELCKGTNPFENAIEEKQNHKVTVCPHCGSLHVQKTGHVHGRQRYLCIDCSKSFGATTNTPMASLKKPGLFVQYIKLVFERKTLKQCEKELGISHQTAFDWRHKILSGLVERMPVIMKGVVECDEMEFRESSKGRRSGLGRKPRKRGTDYKRNDGRHGSNAHQVITAVSRTGETIMVPVEGKKVTTKQIEDSIGDKIEEGSTLITDKNSAYRRFAKDHGLNLKQVLASEHVDRRDRRIHIQHVNAVHSKFRDFVRKHYGISSKYLENYLNWFCYMKDYDPMSDKIGAWLQDLISSALPNENYRRLKKQLIM